MKLFSSYPSIGHKAKNCTCKSYILKVNPQTLFAYHIRAPDKLRICVFYAMKTSKNAYVLSDQSVHITHTYCCVSKLSKFGAYLYSLVHNNTFLSLRNSL